ACLAPDAHDGWRSVLLALTPRQPCHLTIAIAEYQRQKIAETHAFAQAIGAEAIVFEDLSDGFLHCTEEVAARLARDIRQIRPETILAHWGHSIHTDHEQAGLLAQRARFLAGLPRWG